METHELQDKIKTAITSQSLQDGVIEGVVDQFVKEEMDTRKNLLIEAMRTLDTRQAELLKVKPDMITYGADGKPTSENFSKKVIDNKLKLEKQIEELTGAIKLAIDKADYKKLKEKLGKGGQQPSEE